MKTLEELKKDWGENPNVLPGQRTYDQTTFEKIFKARVKKHTNTAMQYFWASFVLQVIVYALLTHVIVTYWSDTTILWFSIAGVLLYLPFTIMLMKKFKLIAATKPVDVNNAGASLHRYTLQYHALLQSFYNFKKSYELILIPLSSVIGVVLIFKLYVPGGVKEHPTGALISFALTLISCAMAIRSENKKSFEQPLRQLEHILEEFDNEKA
jgi:hypothetical protein